MEVNGISAEREAYRVSFDDGAGRVISSFVPEALVAADLGLTGRPDHGLVYRWIEANRRKIETALRALADGTGTPRPPFDALALAEEN